MTTLVLCLPIAAALFAVAAGAGSILRMFLEISDLGDWSEVLAGGLDLADYLFTGAGIALFIRGREAAVAKDIVLVSAICGLSVVAVLAGSMGPWPDLLDFSRRDAVAGPIGLIGGALIVRFSNIDDDVKVA